MIIVCKSAFLPSTALSPLLPEPTCLWLAVQKVALRPMLAAPSQEESACYSGTRHWRSRRWSFSLDGYLGFTVLEALLFLQLLAFSPTLGSGWMAWLLFLFLRRSAVNSHRQGRVGMLRLVLFAVLLAVRAAGSRRH